MITTLLLTALVGFGLLICGFILGVVSYHKHFDQMFQEEHSKQLRDDIQFLIDNGGIDVDQLNTFYLSYFKKENAWKKTKIP